MLRGAVPFPSLRPSAGRIEVGAAALRVRVAGWIPARREERHAPTDTRGRPRAPRWRPHFLLFVLVCVLLGAYHELKTSAIQAWLLSRWAGDATFSIEPGASAEVVFPHQGPYNERLGYTRVPEFQRRLEDRGFRTVEQARFSPALSRLANWGISPPFREPTDAGLRITDRSGVPLFDFSRSNPRFERFDDVPLPVLRSLLYIEDRRLAEGGDPRINPVVDWGRFVGAGARYVGQKVGVPLRLEGGSTLATQMEKYRHSAGGRTESGLDKLRQMTSASLKVYRGGTDTSEERRQIMLDYLNSVPLAAAPRYGEVQGLGEGLRVWFGVELDQVRHDLESPGHTADEARRFKQVVALLYAVRAPSFYLVRHRDALAERVDSTLRMLREAGVVDAGLADLALDQPLRFLESAPPQPPPPLADAKAVAAIRQRLAGLLGVSGLYELDRLHADVSATIDGELQGETAELFRKLADPAFVAERGLKQARLLDRGDPAAVVYSLLLVEATEQGNLIRVHADNLRGAFDVNSGMKMELGSTAKLRTLVHYLDLVAELHGALVHAPGAELLRTRREARDPITHWAAEELLQRPGIDLASFLDEALERRYSASPAEGFFTGGGLHRFHNFEPEDNGLVLSVRQATIRSTNLVFVRLMRDLVRYHEARLPYDSREVLAAEGEPGSTREALLHEIADAESREALAHAFARLHGLPVDDVPGELLGHRADSPRRLAVVYFAWHPDGDADGLAAWLGERGLETSVAEAQRLTRAYGSRLLTLSDYAWLAGVHPMDLWCAGRLAGNPDATWDELLAASGEARRDTSAWLFKTKNRRAQDVRLRTRIERDAFERMTAYWKRVGFPFEHLVPSYASAIGSSADRPTALAELMGILVNDGVKRRAVWIDEVRLGAATPYHTALEAVPPQGERVLPAEVARAARGVLAGVVQEGTARRLRGGFVTRAGTEVTLGGKTGSGDNRRQRIATDGTRISGEPINRTAAFVFFVGERYFGVITASVDAAEAENYRFTSSLPLAVLRLLGPEIAERAAAPRADPHSRATVAEAVPAGP